MNLRQIQNTAAEQQKIAMLLLGTTQNREAMWGNWQRAKENT